MMLNNVFYILLHHCKTSAGWKDLVEVFSWIIYFMWYEGHRVCGLFILK